jgi:allophanate hydrolase
MTPLRLTLPDLRARYADASLSPRVVVEEVLRRIEAAGDDKVWISRFTPEQLREAAGQLERRADAEGIEAMPLYGVPFAVKDNIDVAGLPTTAACPAFVYRPEHSAKVVERLVAAGAIVIGKTNLDQFATGLVGTRSPYGTSRNPFDPDFIPGGSSSGSAVAVSAGLVAFALGTDTAGSGRVPAGFNNIVGLKPTRGMLPNAGVVPACRSLDCVSIFAGTVEDAAAVVAVAAGPDAADPLSRAAPPGFALHPGRAPERFRFGVPHAAQLSFYGNDAAERLFEDAVARMTALGGTLVEIDYAPFAAAAALLYGPFVVERTEAVGDFIDAHPAAIHPVTRSIVMQGRAVGGVALARALAQLDEIRAATMPLWCEIDLLLLPTAPTIYRVAEVEADPVGLNTRLGTYTNFVNLLDLCALAVPNGFRPDGLPSGVTLVGPAWHDAVLAAIGSRFHRAAAATLGATGLALPDAPSSAPAAPFPTIPLAVVGAHLSGMPLNSELTRIGARLRVATRTAPVYRLYALADGKRPGLVRQETGGAAIELEIWDIPAAALGPFLAGIAPPLALGAIELGDGGSVTGFICQNYGLAGARDITEHGGWRAYRRTTA